MTKKFRLITGLLAAVLAAVMLSSAVYIAVEANHNCSGEDCAICHQLNACQHFLKDLGFGGAAAAAVLSLTWFLLERVRTYVVRTPSLTLVSLKVKLSN